MRTNVIRGVVIVAAMAVPALLCVAQMFSDHGPLEDAPIALWCVALQVVGFGGGGFVAARLNKEKAFLSATTSITMVVVVYAAIAAVIDVLTAERRIDPPFAVATFVLEAFFMFVLGLLGAGIGSIQRHRIHSMAESS
jgi:hypothetical protein